MKEFKDFINFTNLGYLVLNCGEINDRKYTKNDYAMYLFSDKEKKTGLGDFVGTFKIVSRNTNNNTVDAYMFNDTVYDSEQQLIDAMTKYNSTLTVPSYFLDPFLVSAAQFERAFTEYMEALGYETGNWEDWGDCCMGTKYTHMYLKNIYGEKLSKISLSMSSTDNDAVSGEIIRFVNNGWSWVTTKFTGYHEMIAAINSVVAPEVIVNAANGAYAASHLTESRKYDDTTIDTVTPSLSLIKKKIKNEAIRILETELKKLKEDTTKE